MSLINHFLLLTAIAVSVSVSAKAPPGHGVVKESKSIACPYLATGIGPSTDLVLVPYTVVETIHYVEPVRNWLYVDLVLPVYSAPFVDRCEAFYARSSC